MYVTEDLVFFGIVWPGIQSFSIELAIVIDFIEELQFPTMFIVACQPNLLADSKLHQCLYGVSNSQEKCWWRNLRDVALRKTYVKSFGVLSRSKYYVVLWK